MIRQRTSPEIIRVIHSHQRHETSDDSPTKPPTTGPNIGPIKAAFANTGKAYTRSIGLQRSDMEPPAQTSGVAAKHPAMKRKTSCAPMFGASADAMTKIMYSERVAI